MAMSKTAGATKAKEAPAPKKAAPKATAVVKAAPKKAVVKKPAAPKLTDPQSDLLKKVAAHADPVGYHAEKKPENKTLEALLKHKLVKKGKKNTTSGNYHYQVSTAGKKHLQAPAAKS
jgi:DnaK suppressor protein